MADVPTRTRIDAVANALGHRFTNPDLLLRGVTHASSVDSQAGASRRLATANEQLEFLGDALLGAAIACLLCERLPEADEGALSRLKAQLVSRASLAEAISRCDLLGHCRVGNLTDPWPDSVKANLAEGLLAAIFLDGGWQALATAVDRLLGDSIGSSDASPAADIKNRLQNWAQTRHSCLPTYSTTRSGGSDHAPEFTCTVCVAEHEAQGLGGSRQRAEQAAAGALLERLQGLTLSSEG